MNRGRGRGRGERGKLDRSARGGGRGGGKNSLVQTSGLFSEGTGETHLRKSSAGKKQFSYFPLFIHFILDDRQSIIEAIKMTVSVRCVGQLLLSAMLKSIRKLSRKTSMRFWVN